MRTRRKLVKKSINASLKFRPVVSESMQLEHGLPQPTGFCFGGWHTHNATPTIAYNHLYNHLTVSG